MMLREGVSGAASARGRSMHEQLCDGQGGAGVSSLAFYIDWSEVSALFLIKRLVTVGAVTGSASRPSRLGRPSALELRHLCDTVA